MTNPEPRTLSAPVNVSFDYTRSVGPVIGTFLGGLRDARFVAGRTSDGRVIIPPPEFDPVTHVATSDLVEVGPGGVVQSWTWVPEPVAGQPFERPFAFALVLLDGATAPLLHAVDASREELAVGMRVEPRWAAARTGAMSDVEAFVPATATPDEAPRPAPLPALAEGAVDPVTGLVTPVALDYVYAASPEESAFFRALEQGRLIGQRCPTCGKVYVPPRGACPVDGVPTTDEVELAHTGTVTTFCVVNVPFLGQKITPPYVSAYVLLDGADIAFLHLVLGVDAADVRMGMRVRAVWRPEDEWGTTVENISHFEPTGEPDADFETYKQHL